MPFHVISTGACVLTIWAFVIRFLFLYFGFVVFIWRHHDLRFSTLAFRQHLYLICNLSLLRIVRMSHISEITNSPVYLAKISINYSILKFSTFTFSTETDFPWCRHNRRKMNCLNPGPNHTDSLFDIKTFSTPPGTVLDQNNSFLNMLCLLWILKLTGLNFLKKMTSSELGGRQFWKKAFVIEHFVLCGPRGTLLLMSHPNRGFWPLNGWHTTSGKFISAEPLLSV